MLKGLLQRLRSADSPALASVYLREGRLFVHSNDRTPWRTAGFWVSTGPVECIVASDSPSLIGRAVLEALARSRVEVAISDPNDLKEWEAKLFKAMRVRSRRASMQGTRYCSVSREQGNLIVEPHRNGGSSGEERGYRPLGTNESLRLRADSSADAVGQAVLTALERATT